MSKKPDREDIPKADNKAKFPYSPKTPTETIEKFEKLDQELVGMDEEYNTRLPPEQEAFKREANSRPRNRELKELDFEDILKAIEKPTTRTKNPASPYSLARQIVDRQRDNKPLEPLINRIRTAYGIMKLIIGARRHNVFLSGGSSDKSRTYSQAEAMDIESKNEELERLYRFYNQCLKLLENNIPLTDISDEYGAFKAALAPKEERGKYAKQYLMNLPQGEIATVYNGIPAAELIDLALLGRYKLTKERYNRETGKKVQEEWTLALGAAPSGEFDSRGREIQKELKVTVGANKVFEKICELFADQRPMKKAEDKTPYIFEIGLRELLRDIKGLDFLTEEAASKATKSRLDKERRVVEHMLDILNGLRIKKRNLKTRKELGAFSIFPAYTIEEVTEKGEKAHELNGDKITLKIDRVFGQKLIGNRRLDYKPPEFYGIDDRDLNSYTLAKKLINYANGKLKPHIEEDEESKARVKTARNPATFHYEKAPLKALKISIENLLPHTNFKIDNATNEPTRLIKKPFEECLEKLKDKYGVLASYNFIYDGATISKLELLKLKIPEWLKVQVEFLLVKHKQIWHGKHKRFLEDESKKKGKN